jgi:N-acetyl-anhydromuramyl-L-alanine amidase AmpD
MHNTLPTKRAPDLIWIAAWKWHIEVDISCSNMPLAPAPLVEEPPMSFKEVQEALRALGWPLRANGQWNDETYEAVRDFQRGYGFGKLDEDGDPGPLTTAGPTSSKSSPGVM